MKRFLQFVSVLFVSTSLGGCTTAKQRIEEQQQLERSIRKTSDLAAVQDCAFIMNLKPDGLHTTPEAQAASLVIPRQGVSWVVFGDSGDYALYSCKTPQNESQEKAPTPPPVEIKSTALAPAPVEAKTAPAQPESQTGVQAPEQSKRFAYKTRVTNNPEAVKGCKFLESFADYRKVSHFQEDVARTGGNLGYIVATNQDGDVIGESYLCSAEAKP